MKRAVNKKSLPISKKTGKAVVTAAIAASSLVPWTLMGTKNSQKNEQRPNVLFILTDNHPLL